MSRTAIKGQVLADLVAEFTEELVEDRVFGSEVLLISAPNLTVWGVYIDGATNHKGSGAGIVLISPEQITMEKSLRL